MRYLLNGTTQVLFANGNVAMYSHGDDEWVVTNNQVSSLALHS